MTRIVTTHYRYKRPSRKWKAVPLAGPAIVQPKRKQAVPLTVELMPSRPAIVQKAKPCNDNRPKPEPVLSPTGEKKSAIVTARRPGRPDVPDMTPEEHQRRGDAAKALFQQMKRRIAKKLADRS
jgi:hypothetical protein